MVETGRAKADKNKQSTEEFPDDEFDDSPEAYADAFSGSKCNHIFYLIFSRII